jgi:hypothetical protein
MLRMTKGFQVYECNGPWRTIAATFDSFAAAESYVQGLGVAHFERDADNAGCADAFMRDGRLLAIEPRARIVNKLLGKA